MCLGKYWYIHITHLKHIHLKHFNGNKPLLSIFIHSLDINIIDISKASHCN